MRRPLAAPATLAARAPAGPAAVATLAALAALALVAPPLAPVAHAVDPPVVNLTHRVDIRRMGDGYLVTGYCRAQADPGDPLAEVPIATRVGCTVNGVPARLAPQSAPGLALPGGDAAITVQTVAAAPIEVCVTGEADFARVLAGDLVTATGGPACSTYPG